MFSDVVDTFDICASLVGTLRAITAGQPTADELESFIIDLETRLEHLAQHVPSFLAAIPVLLQSVADGGSKPVA